MARCQPGLTGRLLQFLSVQFACLNTEDVSTQRLTLDPVSRPQVVNFLLGGLDNGYDSMEGDEDDDFSYDDEEDDYPWHLHVHHSPTTTRTTLTRRTSLASLATALAASSVAPLAAAALVAAFTRALVGRQFRLRRCRRSGGSGAACVAAVQRCQPGAAGPPGTAAPLEEVAQNGTASPSCDPGS